MIYFDSCAFFKLVQPEEHRAALVEYVRESRMPWVASELLQVEVLRVLNRGRITEKSWRWTKDLLGRVALLPVGDVIQRACEIPPASIRSLDAVHLATALSVRPELTAFITYDKRLEEAAGAHELPVVVPRDS